LKDDLMTLTRRELITRTALGGVAAALVPSGRAAAAPLPALPPYNSLIGGVSTDWPSFDASVGVVQIYRDFDGGGFHYPTWKQTKAYARHPTAQANDYSFEILPQVLADPLSGAQAQVAAFLATTPLNLQVTNFHEPDDKFPGKFTAVQHRAGIVALANLVRAQNAIDGGTRRTSVILMNVTFGATGTTKATDWWPTDAVDGGHADIISVDAYALPHATNTSGVPVGYTDGVNWKAPAGLLTNVYNFALARQIPWSVSELGYLEDIHDPLRKSNTIRDVVTWAKAHGAHHVSYFDAKGPRADWRLRYNNPPIPSQSSTSNATLMWRSLVPPS
jgi:hypothetical protein